jgi:hypothetical protein
MADGVNPEAPDASITSLEARRKKTAGRLSPTRRRSDNL